MDSSAADEPGREGPAEHGETPFSLPLVPGAVNDALAAYFSRGPRHRRLYRSLLSLLRLHELRAANAIALDLFLALVPMLALVGWAVTGAVSNDPEALISGSVLLGVTPHEFRDFVYDNLLTLQGNQLAPWATVAGWWLSSSAFFSLIAVFEDSFECVPRPYWQITLLSLGFSLLGFSLLALAGASSMLLTPDGVRSTLWLVGTLANSGLLRLVLALTAYCVASAYLAFVYRFAIRRHARRRVWPGALLAAAIGSGASLAFAAYASHIASYALFYGGLAAVAIVLLWLWLWCTAILVGAEINVTLEDLDALRAAEGPLPTPPPPVTSPPTSESAAASAPRLDEATPPDSQSGSPSS